MLVNLGMTADAAAAHEQKQQQHHNNHHHHDLESSSSSPSAVAAAADQSARRAPQQPQSSRASSSLWGLPLRLMVPGKRDKQPVSDAPQDPPSPATVAPVVVDCSTSSTSRVSSPRGSIDGGDPGANVVVDAPSAAGAGAAVGAAVRNDNVPTSQRQQERQHRAKTSFRYAHPPPSSTRRKRLLLRPRLLLQLHQVAQGSRPIPALDVVPASVLGQLAVGRRPRQFSTSLRAKDKDSPRYAATDLIVVASDRYERAAGPTPATVAAAPAEEDRSISSGADDDNNGNSGGRGEPPRKPLATLRHGRKDDVSGAPGEGGGAGTVDIHVNHGRRWTATPLTQGGYEFTTCDEHGVRKTVRWVLRSKGTTPINRQAKSAAGTGLGLAANDEAGGNGNNNNNSRKRFTFSIIDPRTRRHPIIAWMSRSGVDVLDQYAPSAATRTADTADHQTLVDTDENLRMLIVATGIWIAFREGWSQTPLSSNSDGSHPTASPSLPSPGGAITTPPITTNNANTAVNPPTQPSPSSPASPLANASNGTTEKRHPGRSSLQQLFGRGSTVLRRSGSYTTESWRSARASPAATTGGPSTTTNSGHGVHDQTSPEAEPQRFLKPDYRPRGRRSLRCDRDGSNRDDNNDGGGGGGHRRQGQARSLEQSRSVSGEVRRETSAHHGQDGQDDDGGDDEGGDDDDANGRADAAKEKKKKERTWRRWSSWFDMNSKQKKKKEST